MGRPGLAAAAPPPSPPTAAAAASARRYADSFENAVLCNTNVGGENCHRGAALGALMGFAVGASGIPQRFKDGLHDSAAIKGEIEAFVTALGIGEEAKAEL